MSQKDGATPETQEVNNESVAKEESEAEATVDAKEETIADAIKDKDEHKLPDSIPYNRFKEKVDENKELAARVEELEKAIQQSDLSKKEVSSEVKDIAEEFGIDESVLDKLAQRIQAQAQQTIEEKLAPLTQKERAEKQEKVLSQMLDRAFEAHPEYKGVANPEVIKQLALNPANANKTMSQILSETYGSAVQAPEKKTMETTSPGKSDVIDSVDYNRAQTDSEYFSKIKADPKLKAEYNEKMREQLSRYM